jgi:hypothetical protein
MVAKSPIDVGREAAIVPAGELLEHRFEFGIEPNRDRSKFFAPMEQRPFA